MSTTRVEVFDLDELADELDRLGREWDDIAVDALKGAIVNGGYLAELGVRIPKSEQARYAADLWGTDRNGNARRVELDVKRAGNPDGTGWEYRLPRNWAKRFGVNPADASRVREQYGHGRLLKSIIPDGNKEGAIQVRSIGGGIELVLGSSLDYAARMHQATRPREGEYWRPGASRGWSTPRTGNRYFEVAYERAHERMMQHMVRNINMILSQRGLR